MLVVGCGGGATSCNTIITKKYIAAQIYSIAFTKIPTRVGKFKTTKSDEVAL